MNKNFEVFVFEKYNFVFVVSLQHQLLAHFLLERND